MATERDQGMPTRADDEMGGSDLVALVRTRMLELGSSRPLDLQQLRKELRRVTGHDYTTQTLVNFRSGNRVSLRLALRIAMTGMLPGVPRIEVPRWLGKRWP